MPVLETLANLANVAEIATAFVAVLASLYYWNDLREKRKRLEEYLHAEKLNNPTKSQHTTLYLMANLGLTEDEILRASFKSSRIRRLIHVNETTNLADDILFEWLD
jgi:hypothetical protein